MKDKRNILFGIVVLILIVGICVVLFLNNKTISEIRNELLNLKSEKEINLARIQELEGQKQLLEGELGIASEELGETKEKTEKLNNDVETISKLINTDEELLQKYSKVYFLNEHYVPKSLSYIEDTFLANKEKPLQIHSEVLDNLEDMLKDAIDDGVDLRVVSAFRSFGEQASLKYNYSILYGSSANTFSADQGYSEHQLGTTVDLTSTAIGTNLVTSFDQTEAYKWLSKNAYKYGFVMSYPKSNSYYQYEPWHWRFVSKDFARYLNQNEKNFYDIDQRDTMKYLIDFFD